MQIKKLTFAGLVAILGLLSCAGACHHGRTPAPIAEEKAPPPTPPPAPTVRLNAEPDTIDFDSSATLSWSSQNATALDLEPGVGIVQSSGSTSVTLRNSTTYTLSATGLGGTKTATVRVTVRPPGPPPQPSQEGPIFDPYENSVHDAYFDFDTAEIRPDANTALTGDANFLREHHPAKFTIEGHCDDRGSEEYNLALGDKRATAAKSFLVTAGVSEELIHTISYGKSRPASGCDESSQSEDCWQKNRVAHFHLGWVSK